MSDAESSDEQGVSAVVLDYLPHGRTEDDRPQYQKQPLVYALDTAEFQLYEVVFTDAPDITIGDTFDVEDIDADRTRTVEFDDISGGARSELEYAVEDIVAENESRFVDFYNDAQPITLRLHQLNLLPGIGKKLRNAILDERERKSFESFEELASRVNGLHDPEGVLVERILEEIRQDDLKYRTFARAEE
jgi:putative nucleotide binding protein